MAESLFKFRDQLVEPTQVWWAAVAEARLQPDPDQLKTLARIGISAAAALGEEVDEASHRLFSPCRPPLLAKEWHTVFAAQELVATDFIQVNGPTGVEQ